MNYSKTFDKINQRISEIIGADPEEAFANDEGIIDALWVAIEHDQGKELIHLIKANIELVAAHAASMGESL